MTQTRKIIRGPKAVPILGLDDVNELLSTVAHIPDRDQEFRVVEIEPASGVVPDPAFNRDGADRMLRLTLGDRSVEEHMTPAARAGQGGSDDPRGIEHLSRAALQKRAGALGIPGRGKMNKAQLSAAMHGAMQI